VQVARRAVARPLVLAGTTRIELAHAIFEYLEIFHNRQGRHSALGYLTAIAFENKATPVA
jgi:hypothetical protein